MGSRKIAVDLMVSFCLGEDSSEWKLMVLLHGKNEGSEIRSCTFVVKSQICLMEKILYNFNG